jgi:hypothetical protein
MTDWLPTTTSRAELLGTLLGMVLSMCRQLGMTEDDAAEMFSRDNISQGYAILSKREGK